MKKKNSFFFKYFKDRFHYNICSKFLSKFTKLQMKAHNLVENLPDTEGLQLWPSPL